MNFASWAYLGEAFEALLERLGSPSGRLEAMLGVFGASWGCLWASRMIWSIPGALELAQGPGGFPMGGTGSGPGPPGGGDGGSGFEGAGD